MEQEIDFNIVGGTGFYTLFPDTPAAVERLKGDDTPVYIDSTQYVEDIAVALMREGFTVALEGRELMLREDMQ
jgi:hypothetical protein